MSSCEKLQKITSLREFAILLGYQPKALSYILYKVPNDQKYIEFIIPKKNGGERKIKAPVDQVKRLQRRLADLLNKCFAEVFPENSHLRPLSHGFKKGQSIISNANNHIRKRHVFNIDLLDFFPSINFGRVRGFFIKNAHFSLDPKVATIIAQIACHENELPQGSPCSPIISNFIGHLLDIRMVNLAKKAKCTYSRYADDLTFSTNKKEFSEKIAVKNNGNEWISGEVLKKEVEKLGFKINEKKTSLQYKTARQIATGLVANKKVNIKREYYRKTRSMCHSLFQSNQFCLGNNPIASTEIGIAENLQKSEVFQSDSANIQIGVSLLEEKVKGRVKQLEGILSFIYHVKRLHEKRPIKKRKYDPNGITKIFRKFLFYKHFFFLNRPLIVCEGKTDITYLKCALKQLEEEYREFVEKTGDNFEFKIGFLNLSENLKDILAISAGTGGLASLMDIYETYMKPFKGEGKKHPVIILIDNDSGSDEIITRLRKSGNGDTSKPFSFFSENLYVVRISARSGTEELAIEDLFDKRTLEATVGGKKFNRKSNIDNLSEYGKNIFAKKVVKENQSNINFGNFKETFDCFKEVIADWNQKRAKLIT